MRYRNQDVEIIYRSAISNAEWAKDVATRLYPSAGDALILRAVNHLRQAADDLNRARDEWRSQLNTGEKHGEAGKEPIRPH